MVAIRTRRLQNKKKHTNRSRTSQAVPMYYLGLRVAYIRLLGRATHQHSWCDHGLPP